MTSTERGPGGNRAMTVAVGFTEHERALGYVAHPQALLVLLSPQQGCGPSQGDPQGTSAPNREQLEWVRREAKAVLLTKLRSLLTSLCLGSPHTWSPGTQPPGPASPQLPEDQLSLLVS